MFSIELQTSQEVKLAVVLVYMTSSGVNAVDGSAICELGISGNCAPYNLFYVDCCVVLAVTSCSSKAK